MSGDIPAFSFAQSVVQQVLTLSTGVTALTLTFFDQFAKHPSALAKGFLIGSWVVLAVSILCGVAALMTLTGNLQLDKPSISAKNIRMTASAQIVTFAIGIVATVVAGALAV